MFSRYLAVAVLSTIVVFGARYYPRPLECSAQALFEPQEPAAMSPAERDRHEHLVDVGSRRGSFAELTESLTGQLTSGTIGLREATERLFYYCVQNYPEHLEHVALAETGQNIKTMLAANLLRSFRSAREHGCGVTPNDELLARLDRELRELPYEAEAAGRIVQH